MKGKKPTVWEHLSGAINKSMLGLNIGYSLCVAMREAVIFPLKSE